MGLKSNASNYGSVAIAIHWVSAAAIIALLVSGTVLAGAVGEAKRSILPVHAAVGSLVLLLTFARIGWWIWGDKRPQPLPGQPRAQELVAQLVHGLLYAAIVALGATGIATMALSGAIPALLTGAALPDLSELLPRVMHGIVSKVMIGLLVLHVGAALYHQFIRRDQIMARMGIGRR